jgi:hypothetical protein
MTFRNWFVSRPEALLLAAVVALGIGCGSSGGDGGGGGNASGAVGPTGGTVSIAGGPSLVVPASALSSTTTITIQATGGNGPSGGPIYQFSPDGTVFGTPATVAIPVPSGVTNPRIYWTAAGSSTQYEALATTVSGATASAQVSHFSLGYVGPGPQVATPTFSPAAGTFAAAQSVAISTTTPGATLYYTTNGTDPTTASTTYTAPVSVTTSSTLKAIATATGYTTSAVATAAYVIGGTTPQAATPTFSPGSGTYTAAQSVTISSTTPGAAIHYTTNGIDPTAASTTYTAPVAVAAGATLKAIATATGFTTSAVGSATYVINTGGGSTDFTTLCQNSLTDSRNLLTTCLQANPDYVNAIITSGVFECTTIGKEITAGRVAYNATQASACAAALGSLTCSLFSSDTPAACASVLTGTVASGGACYLDEDCATGVCNSTASTCPGTCQAYAQLNQSCATATCAPGLSCDALICKAESAVGGPCPCQTGLWCDSSGASPVCKAALALGASCSTASDQCNALTKCAGTPATCQSFVGLGASCTAGSSPFDSLCGIGYLCSSVTNKCVSFPKLGEACGTSNPVCIASYCDQLVTQKCAAYKRIGDACSWPVDILACEPGSSCDSVTSKCKASAPTTCQAP